MNSNDAKLSSEFPLSRMGFPLRHTMGLSTRFLIESNRGTISSSCIKRFVAWGQKSRKYWYAVNVFKGKLSYVSIKSPVIISLCEAKILSGVSYISNGSSSSVPIMNKSWKHDYEINFTCIIFRKPVYLDQEFEILQGHIAPYTSFAVF